MAYLTQKIFGVILSILMIRDNMIFYNDLVLINSVTLYSRIHLLFIYYSRQSIQLINATLKIPAVSRTGMSQVEVERG